LPDGNSSIQPSTTSDPLDNAEITTQPHTKETDTLQALCGELEHKIADTETVQ
jgi:hypothetical protein